MSFQYGWGYGLTWNTPVWKAERGRGWRIQLRVQNSLLFWRKYGLPNRIDANDECPGTTCEVVAQNYRRPGLLLEIISYGIVIDRGPPLLYMLFYRMDIARISRFNGIKPAEVLLILGMANFGYGVTIIINLIWYWVVSRWGHLSASNCLP